MKCNYQMIINKKLKINMKYFSSDTHFGESRIGINGKPNLFYRPFFSIEEQDNIITNNFINSTFKDGDEFWHLGDVLYDINSEYCLEKIRNKLLNNK